MTSKLAKIATKIVVKDAFKRTNIINPSQVIFDCMIQKDVKVRKLQRLERCLNAKPFDAFTLNGAKIFESIDDRTRGRISKVFGGSAEYHKGIIVTATKIATEMLITDANRFMSIIEYVSSEVEDLHDNKLQLKLNYIQTAGKYQLINEILQNLVIASDISNTAELSFADALMAVYHFKKHKKEFALHFKDFTIKEYLTELPKVVFQDCHLREICIIQHEKSQLKAEKCYETVAIKKTYVTPSDYLGVKIETSTNETISTLYVKPDMWKSMMKSSNKFILFQSYIFVYHLL